MINQLVRFFRDQNILILGFGREGRSTYDLIRQHLPEQKLFLADQDTELLTKHPHLKQDQQLTCLLGDRYLDHLEEFDIIMKTPGISLKDIDTTDFVDKITSQLELLLKFSQSRTIGVTGTKGKSTTSSLVYQILQDQQIDSVLLGNIGIPVFEHLSEITPNKTIVLEMSSHQLEFMRHSPNIAVLLNVYEEHLDHYRSFEAYVQAKCNIYRHQTPDDTLIYNYDDPTLRKLVQNPRAQVYRVSLKDEQPSEIYLREGIVYAGSKAIYEQKDRRHLLGDYNLNNIMFALAVAETLKLDLDQARASIAKFQPLRHRLEFVGEYHHILYYDNSIGTVPQATIEAIKALGNVDTVIIGGMDRGINYAELIEFLRQASVRNVICMPKTGFEIGQKLPAEKVHFADDLEKAVDIARQVTAPGKACLLSPAAASYGFFKNFEEKGDKFQELVRS